MRWPPPTSSMPVSYGSMGGDVMVASMWRSALCALPGARRQVVEAEPVEEEGVDRRERRCLSHVASSSGQSTKHASSGAGQRLTNGSDSSTQHPRWMSGAGVGQVGRVGDIDLGDVPGKVTLVAGDEPVGAGADGGGQVGRVGGLQPVSGRLGRGELGGRQVDRAQVKPGQEPGEDPDLVCRAVAQWPAEYFGEQQDRAGAGWGGGARAAEQSRYPPAQ